MRLAYSWSLTVSEGFIVRKTILRSALELTFLLPFTCIAQTPDLSAQNQSAPPALHDDTRAQVEDRLKLTAPQLPYWGKYQATLDAYSKLFYEEKPIGTYASDTAPRQFARLTSSLQNRLAALEDIEDAAKALYASLNGEQQAIANQSMISTVPTFASAANCVPMNTKTRADKREAPQRTRRSGTVGGTNASGGDLGNQIPIQY